jgi:hypothetical protein
MHLVCLGIVKRVLLFLKKGPRECRLSHQQLVILSERLSSLNGKMPREFARQPRSIFYLDKWKATEFRQFLLYTGPLVLRTVVSERLYKHFLTLTVAFSLFSFTNANFLFFNRKQLSFFFVEICICIFLGLYLTLDFSISTILLTTCAIGFCAFLTFFF